MKKFLLIVGALISLNFPHTQAKWEEFKYKNKFTNFHSLSVVSPQSIWASVQNRDKSGKPTTSLFKWNEAKGKFELQSIPFSSRHSIYPFDKGLFVLFPTMHDQRTKKISQYLEKELFLFAKQELEKLVLAKKIPPGVVDRFRSIAKKHSNYGAALMSIEIPSFIAQAYPEVRERKVLDAIMKASKAVDKKRLKLIKGFIPGFTRPLKLFLNGKLKMIRDFKNLGIVTIRALSSNDIWVITRKTYHRGPRLPNIFIEHWNGKGWVKKGETKQYSRKIQIGFDGSIFAITLKGVLVEWNGSIWEQLPIQFDREFFELNFSVISANDIWFSCEHRKDANHTTTFFHWNGKEIEQRGSLKNSEARNMAVAPGITLITDCNNKIYKWVDEPKKDKLILPKINNRIIIKPVGFVPTKPDFESPPK